MKKLQLLVTLTFSEEIGNNPQTEEQIRINVFDAIKRQADYVGITPDEVNGYIESIQVRPRILGSDWIEVHHEIVAHMSRCEDTNETIQKIMNEQGRGGLWELAEELTDKFMELHNEHLNDGELLVKLSEFLDEELV